jgi:molybdopterin converting factor small subunit
MGKIKIHFSAPLNLYTEKNQIEMEIGSEIKIRELENCLVERFPSLKKSSVNLNYIYYVVEQKILRDKEAVIKEGQEVQLYQPTIGG